MKNHSIWKGLAVYATVGAMIGSSLWTVPALADTSSNTSTSSATQTSTSTSGGASGSTSGTTSGTTTSQSQSDVSSFLGQGDGQSADLQLMDSEGFDFQGVTEKVYGALNKLQAFQNGGKDGNGGEHQREKHHGDSPRKAAGHRADGHHSEREKKKSEHEKHGSEGREHKTSELLMSASHKLMSASEQLSNMSDLLTQMELNAASSGSSGSGTNGSSTSTDTSGTSGSGSSTSGSTDTSGTSSTGSGTTGSGTTSTDTGSGSGSTGGTTSTSSTTSTGVISDPAPGLQQVADNLRKDAKELQVLARHSSGAATAGDVANIMADVKAQLDALNGLEQDVTTVLTNLNANGFGSTDGNLNNSDN